MAAGYKDFTAGATLAAADLEDYCELQSVMRFASTAARDTALAGVLTNGLLAYTTDTSTRWRYTGSAWVSDGGGKVLQTVNTQTGEVATGATAMPWDDTIPQNTEGTQFMTLAITPQSASSYLLISVVAILAETTTQRLQAALFVDTTANAIAATHVTTAGSNAPVILSFNHYVASASTTARTYKLRAGSSTAVTTTFNGYSSGRIFGGVASSSITIMEIAA